MRCGSDFVQKGQRAPYVYNGRAERTTGGRTRGLSLGCSLDGDSDRIVFYAHGGDGNVDRDGGMPFTLLDGDKISSLLASFVRQELSALSSPPCRPLSVAVVQTAYANDASAAYLRSLDVTTECTATGVMHLHHAASKYDVGIYFESNGHGTVLFSQIFHELVRSRRDNETRRQTVTRKRLAALARIMNPSVGDALSDLLAVMGVLYLGGNGAASVGRWAGMYRDRPTRQRQVRVGDRSVVMTNATETRVTSPSILQRVLDLESRAMARGGAGGAGLPPRCFVRPSLVPPTVA